MTTDRPETEELFTTPSGQSIKEVPRMDCTADMVALSSGAEPSGALFGCRRLHRVVLVLFIPVNDG